MKTADQVTIRAGRPKGISTAGLATRDHILVVARRLFAEKTYSGVGLSELLREADCPKGSFYHYFASKEALALELVRATGEADGAAMTRLLSGYQADPLQGVRRIFEAVRDRAEVRGIAQACLIARLAVEAPQISEELAAAVKGVLDSWARTIAKALDQAQARQQFPADLDTKAMADFMMVSWEGVLAKASLLGDLSPLQLFIDTMFDTLLVPRTMAPSA
jgi:TetR/AcrR family transcriptional repressor of nem operon